MTLTPPVLSISGRLVCGCEPLPVALGDHFDDAVEYFEGRLIVDGIHRHRHRGGSLFDGCQGGRRRIGGIQVRTQCKIDES